MLELKPDWLAHMDDVYIYGVHPYAFRTGKIAKVIGMKWVQPDYHKSWRLCYQVEYYDGFVDYVPVSEVSLEGENKTYCLYNHLPVPGEGDIAIAGGEAGRGDQARGRSH
jgi:hypothetical protein